MPPKFLFTAFLLACGAATFCQSMNDESDTLASFHLQAFLKKLELVKADTNLVGVGHNWKTGSYKLKGYPENEIKAHIEHWKWKNRLKTGLTSKRKTKVKFRDGSELYFKQRNNTSGVFYLEHHFGNVENSKQPWWKAKIKLVNLGNDRWMIIGKHHNRRKEFKIWFSGQVSGLALD